MRRSPLALALFPGREAPEGGAGPGVLEKVPAALLLGAPGVCFVLFGGEAGVRERE